MSHPTGVRGLKFKQRAARSSERRSHPTGVRGLKSVDVEDVENVRASHPTGVRGLKCNEASPEYQRRMVAPHWGAWIEIYSQQSADWAYQSHPTGVRGLKFTSCYNAAEVDCRTPLGCVD